MASHNEKLTQLFLNWEMLGRGGLPVCELPVFPEPPFRPFTGYRLPRKAVVDDGRRHTAISAFLEASRLPPPLPEEGEEPSELHFDFLDRSPLVEIKVAVPADFSPAREVSEGFLLALTGCREPVSFELFGTRTETNLQFVAGEPDVATLRAQLASYYPEVTFTVVTDFLERTWEHVGPGDPVVVECALTREFYFPIATGRIDPFVGFIGALSDLYESELGLLQVIFEPARYPWTESILRTLSDERGRSYFNNTAALERSARNKVARPLYAAVVRLAAQGPNLDRSLEVLRSLGAALEAFSDPNGNALVPISNEDYPEDAQIADVLQRQSRRFGMLLNSNELAGLVHLPAETVRSPKLARQDEKTRPAPEIARHADLVLGSNTHMGEEVLVGLSADQRASHTYVIGASGTGKSNFLLHCIKQDLMNGEGVGVLDPHGDLIDRVLAEIPDERIDDVILLDPSDEGYPVGFNILSAHSDTEKNILASDLVSVFQRLSTSWGDQMTSVLSNAVLAFLESDKGGTLADLRRFLVEKNFRAEFLESVTDPEVVYYWQHEFPLIVGKPQASVLTRLNTFLRPKPIRYMVSQRENKLDFAKIMDEGKIFLAKLPKGAIGEENVYLLGTLLVTKFHQLVLGRQQQEEAKRKNFWLYLDEFHDFITPSMASILSGARKYRLGLILAHQDLRQLLARDLDVASSVIANPLTQICFRIGNQDARKLEDGFDHYNAGDLQKLSKGHAICRIERADYDFNLAVPLVPHPAPAEASERTAKLVALSREKYAVPREEVEALLAQSRPLPKTAKAPTKEPPEPEAPEVAPTPTAAPKPDKKPPPAQKEPAPPEPEPAPETEPEPEPVAQIEEPPLATPRPPPLPIAPPPPSPAVREEKEHEYLQNLFGMQARGMGYQVSKEEEIPGTKKRIDLVLAKGETTIAVEIWTSTKLEHELGNLAKCLEAGYPIVMMLCKGRAALMEVQKAAGEKFTPADFDRLRFYTEGDAVAFLEELAAREEGVVKKVGGWTVKTSYKPLSEKEKQSRNEQISKTINEAIDRLKKDPGP